MFPNMYKSVYKDMLETALKPDREFPSIARAGQSKNREKCAKSSDKSDGKNKPSRS